MAIDCELCEWYWFAGFYEGEGCASSGGPKNRQFRLSINQVNREPLERVVALAGGIVHGPYKSNGQHNSNPHFAWNVLGADAFAVAERVLPMLSEKRQRQVLQRMHEAPLSSHYKATTDRYRKISREEAFWKYVTKTDGCWLWTGPKTGRGQGRFNFSRGFTIAHRAGYEIVVGPIPGATELIQSCQNRLCVNPSHMQLVKSPTHRRLAFSRQNHITDFSI